MFAIRHKENKNYYKSKINKDIKHFVVDIKEARKIKIYRKAREILNEFKHKENYEIIKVDKNGGIM